MAVDLPTGLAGNPAFGDGDRVTGVENVLDGSEEGTVTGTAADNALAGGEGDDYVDGGPGADRLDGGDGPDVVAARDAVVDAPCPAVPASTSRSSIPATGRDGAAPTAASRSTTAAWPRGAAGCPCSRDDAPPAAARRS